MTNRRARVLATIRSSSSRASSLLRNLYELDSYEYLALILPELMMERERKWPYRTL